MRHVLQSRPDVLVIASGPQYELWLPMLAIAGLAVSDGCVHQQRALVSFAGDMKLRRGLDQDPN